MATLSKWDVLRVSPPGVGHTKFAVCICPERRWFFYINSNKPFGRKSAAAAVTIAAFEAHFLRKSDSFLDVAVVVELDEVHVRIALNSSNNHLGRLLPAVRSRVVASVRSVNVLEPSHREAVLDGEA